MKRAAFVACLLLTAGAASGTCARPPASLLTERFLSAACAACWSSGDAVDGAVIDWVAPAADDAPLADAALPEAARRAPGLSTDRMLERQSLLSPARLRVVDGIALNGYIGLQLEVTRGTSSTAGLVGYMALVERIRAGRDGTPIDRQLVRALVGPLSLAELGTASHVRHLAAVRVPPMAQPERLASVGWLEDGAGQIVAFAESAPAGCR